MANQPHSDVLGVLRSTWMVALSRLANPKVPTPAATTTGVLMATGVIALCAGFRLWEGKRPYVLAETPIFGGTLCGISKSRGPMFCKVVNSLCMTMVLRIGPCVTSLEPQEPRFPCDFPYQYPSMLEKLIRFPFDCYRNTSSQVAIILRDIMATDNLDTSALNMLRSTEQQSLLDEIDSLRLQGMSEFVFLPQIVVCGDQSSGKSSVLEAISGLPFPRSDTLCTRFATEVILRQAPKAGAAVSIVPSQGAPGADRSRLLAFRESLQGLDDFPDLIERAKSEMGASATGRAFSKSILRVEISGPTKPKLTVVDLPGLIHSESKQQSAEDVELVSDLVQSYMKNPRSVILAVVSAKNDYANQIVLKRAREVDPEGLRTLGLITKPDTLPPNSDSEADFINLASNDNIHFRLGWHIVKNRDYDSRDSSTEERDRSEERFFSEGVWMQLPRDMCGVDSLRQRLSKILLEQIKRYLPSLMDDIQFNIQECRKKLLKLGDSRDTIEKQRQFLLKLSQSFQTLCKAAIDGNYEHKFFGDPSLDDEYSKRLRAVVQNLNLAFSELMRKKGHHRIIVDVDGYEAPAGNSVEASSGDIRPLLMSRKEALEWVRKLLVKSRGRELPGSFNPLLVGEFFRDQSMFWEKIAHEHVKQIWLASKAFLERLLYTIMDHETLGALFTHWIDPSTSERFEKANQALDRLLVDRERHPITYNHYYTDVLQGVREDRQMKQLQSKIKHFLGTSSDSLTVFSQSFSVSNLAKSLSTHPESDMDTFACSELLDSMQAYYKNRIKVALKTFVDNVCIQVVESLLIGDMWSIFSPTDVGQMSSILISKIAAESIESQTLRQQLERKLHTFERGLEICQRHSTHNPIGHSSSPASRGEAQEELLDNTNGNQSKALHDNASNHSSSPEHSLPVFESSNSPRVYEVEVAVEIPSPAPPSIWKAFNKGK